MTCVLCGREGHVSANCPRQRGKWRGLLAKMRAPAYVYWNLLQAAMGHHVGPFLDRKGTSPARKRTWRALLTLVLVVHLPVFLAIAWTASWGLRYVPYGVAAFFLYGSVREIWRS